MAQYWQSDPDAPLLISTGLYAPPGEVVTIRLTELFLEAIRATKGKIDSSLRVWVFIVAFPTLYCRSSNAELCFSTSQVHITLINDHA